MRQVICSYAIHFARTLCLVVFGICLGWVNAAAQSNTDIVPIHEGDQLTTRLFNARDGLPDNKVYYFLETQKSPYRWAASKNELCRFDGYRFQSVWGRLPDISGLAENGNGALVMLHLEEAQKISCFEPELGIKKTFSVSDIPNLQGTLTGGWSQDTMIFLLTEQLATRQLRVYRFFPDFQVRMIKEIDLPERSNSKNLPVQLTSVFQYDENLQALWYSGTLFERSDRMLRYDLQTTRTDTFILPGATSSSRPDWVSVVQAYPDKLYVVSTLSNSIWGWSASNRLFEIVGRKPDSKIGLKCIGTDHQGALIFRKPDQDVADLWLLNREGVWRDLKPILPNLNYNLGVGQDFSRQINFASLEGVVRVNFEKPLFSQFVPKVPGRISNAFRGIAADKQGNVWMMGEMTGLFVLRPGHPLVEHCILKERISGQEILTDNSVNLQRDAAGKIWSARNCVCAFNLLRMDPESLLADTFSIKNIRITTFTILKNGLILIAGNGEKSSSMLMFDPETRQITPLNNPSQFLQSAPLFLLENPNGMVWVGNKEGLSLFDLNAKKGIPFLGDQPEAHEFPVSTLLVQGDSVLWCGTLGGGLRKLNLNTGDWKVFTLANGLSANKIAGILSDEKNNLWISTYDGLSFFQPSSQLFANFFTANGLSHNEFNRLSAFRNSDETLFFGGLNGVNFFKPSMVLGSFSQGNDALLLSQVSYFASDGKSRIEQIYGLQNLQKITLPADNRYCGIRLALANYLQPEANRFAWKLEGYDADWHLNGTNNEIIFHYLPAGKYHLLLKAANPTGVWGLAQHSLEIEVREFWYKTWWAVCLSGFLLLGLFFLYYRYQVNQKLAQAETLKIKELEALKTRLYTNITHEFRTPLTVILGMADEMEQLGKIHQDPTNTPILRAAEMIRRNGKNLLRLINQLLDLSKLDSGMLKTQMVQGDIIAYLRYLTESFYSLAEERKLRLTFYPETARILMDFDEEKIQVIVNNLLSNALKFTGEGGKVVLHAAEVVQNQMPFLQLKIQDTGLGITEDQLPYIFDRFYQAEHHLGSGKGEGTGIGLTLVKEYITLMGGSIHVASEIGVGTTFSIWLPIIQAPHTAKQSREETLSSGKDAAQSLEYEPGWTDRSSPEKPLLLLIEDNSDVVRYIVGILREDYQIVTAANGSKGIEKAFEFVPDIIISDVMMPEKDGYEVCSTLKKDERTSHIPIVLLTAKASQQDKVTGLQMGADAYLEKPFNKQELFIRLEKLLELRKRLQERYGAKKAADPQTGNKASGLSLEDVFLQRIRAVIVSRMDDSELGMLHLCQAVHLSHTQVFRKLKALTGENPTHFIRNIRLQKARELLQSTRMSISEIAYSVGFTDPNYFSRAFAEAFGEPPSAMRK